MSCCEGKTKCRIYREKRFCTKGKDEGEVCNCRHARLTCEVDRCIFESICGKSEGLNDRLERKEGDTE